MKHNSESRRGASAPTEREKKNKRILLIGWIFLGVVALLVIGAAVYLLLPRESRDDTPSSPEVRAVNITPVTEQEEHRYTASAEGGGTVSIRKILCDFQEPETLTYGVLTTADLTPFGERACANVRAAGWGAVKATVSQDGSLILSGEEAPLLTADAYEQQKEFLASSQPENLARTFLEQSGLVNMLRELGITLSTDVTNEDGEITFTGTGDTTGGECTITFSFLYTGAFNQARLRCTVLSDATVTDQVVTLRRAASQAVSWSYAGDEEVNVDGVEIRSVRGLPFYVFHCDNGENAYALAISRDALAAVPATESVYSEIMAGGIQEMLVLSGAE